MRSRASFLLAFLLPFCSTAPAPFDAKHKHDGNDSRDDKVFENSEIHMGDLTVDTATGDNMQIGHKLDINVVQTHGVHSAKENADDSHGNAAPTHSHHGDFEERLRRLFKSMDTDEDGIISVTELIRICNENDIYITELEAQNVLTYPSETIPFTLSYFLAILENAASSSDTGDLIHFLLRSAGSQDHLMFDNNMMHVFLVLDADHDCMIFVPDVLSVFQDMGKTVSLDEAKRLLSGYSGHNHHDGVDYNLWKKLILGEVFKQDEHLVNYWRDAFIEVKKSFNVEVTTVGDENGMMWTDVENAAKTAVKALKHGSELGECYQGELVKVESATVEVKEGLLYKLQLRISTMGGDDCMEIREMVCENIFMAKPLPKDCKGTDTLKLFNREHITCQQKVEKVGFEACVDEWCLQDGTDEQYTRCEEATDGGDTCINPLIKYGTTEGGIPIDDYDGYNEWCKMIFHEERTGSVTQGKRDCSAPKGYVYWCEGSEGHETDEDGYKWCDVAGDGKWKDGSLDSEHSEDDCWDSITSFSCTTGENGPF